MIRTFNPLIRSQILYPVELQARLTSLLRKASLKGRVYYPKSQFYRKGNGRPDHLLTSGFLGFSLIIHSPSWQIAIRAALGLGCGCKSHSGVGVGSYTTDQPQLRQVRKEATVRHGFGCCRSPGSHGRVCNMSICSFEHKRSRLITIIHCLEGSACPLK
jgi:hypothetical protein